MLAIRRFAPFSFALTLTVTASAASADVIKPESPGDRVHYNLAVDLPITLSAASIWLGTQLLQPSLAPAACRWCDRESDGSDAVNALDEGTRDAFRWSNTGAANTASNVIGYGLSPAAAVGLTALAGGLEGRLKEAPANALLIAEATAASAVLNQLVKFAAGRERPFVHALPEGEKQKTEKPSDNNVSFYSGHTNFCFALAVSSGTVAQMRGYRYAPVVWATGLAMATSVGYLRIAADKHYLTDVITGAVIGSAAGFALPFFLHRGDPARSATKAAGDGTAAGALERAARRERSLSPSSVEAGPASVSLTWQW